MGKEYTQDLPPALILGTGLTVLGVLRCLGREGIPAECLSAGADFESHSRWYTSAGAEVENWVSARDLELFLEALPYDRAVLIPCSDHWTTEVTRLPESLKDRYCTSLPDPETIGRLIDKERFRAELVAGGIPHPWTEPVRDEAHLLELIREAPAGAFLKPADSQRFLTAFGRKAFSVSTAEEAALRFRQCEEAGVVVVLQEYVPGSADRHYFIDGFVDRDHSLAAVFARRRLRMYPRDFGNSSCMVSVETSEVSDAIDSLRTLFERTRYRGIFSAEFKLDEHDGRFKIIEVNCRPWWYVEFAARCGVNVVEMAYRDALGESAVAARDYRVGVELVYTYYDFHACRELLHSGRIRRIEWLQSWLMSSKAIFSWDDLRPSLWNLVRRVRNFVAARFSH